MEGLVRYGINNRYTVDSEHGEFECTLKGKQLDTGGREYTALAAGDRVEFQIVSEEHRHGVIERRCDRKSKFARWNMKRGSVQVLAANIDGVVCVASTNQPPFRARFVDRVAVTAEWYEIDFILAINKCDFGISDEVAEYATWMDSLGYRVVLTSALDGTGVDDLAGVVSGRRFLFVGHSGVGKSSLINSLVPEADLAVGEISRKYGKGVHTTRHSLLMKRDNDGWIIDAPGIREIELVPEIEGSLAHCFPEIRELVSECEYPGCTHQHEPGCAIVQAWEDGELPDVRYESYCILYQALEERNRILRES